MSILKPRDEAEISEIIAGARDPIAIQGGATHGISLQGDVLSTAEMSGIVEYEPGALTLVAKAGTSVADIETALAREGQRLAFEPMDYRRIMDTKGTPTIGGVVATNASGPRRIQAGACRDFLLGVRFVDGMGQVLKNGGRVMKNVTGYDLVKLLAGSYGTLGVITEVSFKVLPEPPMRAVLLLYGLDDATAIRALTRVLRSPFEISGAAHVPVGFDGQSVTLIRIEGFEQSILYRSQKLVELLDEFGPVRVDVDDDRTKLGWTRVRDLTPLEFGHGDVWRISVKPSDAPGMVANIRARWDVEVMYDWGGGLVWIVSPEAADVRSQVGRGHATRIRGHQGTMPKFTPEHPRLGAISQGIRDRFDPRGILNPGLMG